MLGAWCLGPGTWRMGTGIWCFLRRLRPCVVRLYKRRLNSAPCHLHNRWHNDCEKHLRLEIWFSINIAAAVVCPSGALRPAVTSLYDPSMSPVNAVLGCYCQCARMTTYTEKHALYCMSRTVNPVIEYDFTCLNNLI